MLATKAASAASGGWDYEPYRIRALVVLDLPGGLYEQLSQELPSYLQRRVDSALAPVWVFDARLATGAERVQAENFLTTGADTKPADLAAERDKLLLLSVTWTAAGYEITAREYDAYLQRWGVAQRRECHQLSALPETVFALAFQTIAPLAQFEVDADNPQKVTLKPRGAALPPAMDAPPWTKPGDVFAPVLRRTSRAGQLIEHGVAQVPWTYIETIVDKDKSLGFRVQSGSRHPFAGRRQGRVEQLAIAVRSDSDPTTLYLHSRKNDKKPLVGYEVLTLDTGTNNQNRIGISDAAGEVQILPGKSPIEMLLVKHGGQLLAKLPVVPGAKRQINVPLPDDEARLTAESRLAGVREDLIDVVARRNILIARTRQKIEKKDFAGAEQLLRALDDLPGKSQFTSALDTSERLIRSDDPQIQRRIKQLFDATRTLAAQFLDSKPISEIHDSLREAQQQAQPKAGST